MLYETVIMDSIAVPDKVLVITSVLIIRISDHLVPSIWRHG